MARKYHSASSLELGRSCLARWLHRYVLYTPAAETKRDALDFGLAVHDIAERVWDPARGSIAPKEWETEPGKVYAAMYADILRLAPDAPKAKAFVEQHIGDVPMKQRGENITCMRWGGVLWSGKPDLIVAGKTWDYKSTANLSYAKSVSTLVGDIAANIYALDYMRKAEVTTHEMVWLYAEKKTYRSKPVTFRLTFDSASDIVESAGAECIELDAHANTGTDPATVTNPGACRHFGTVCEYHHSIGGPCRPGATLTQLKKKADMSDAASIFKAKLAAAAAAKLGGAPTEAPAEAPAEVNPEAESPDAIPTTGEDDVNPSISAAEAPPPPVAAGARPRVPRPGAKAAAARGGAVAPAGSISEALKDLCAQLAAEEAAVAFHLASCASVRAEITALVAG